MSAIIALRHVNQWYNKGKENEVHALNDISLEIEQGDYVAFFGPSGCGKTTLLYATSGIDRISDGEILIKSRDIAHFSNQELAIFRQTGIGIIFQQFNLVPSLTVLQNVALPLAFVGVHKEKAEEEAAKLLKKINLEKYATHYPTELSGGQQQRVGIARALANNPPIIIADEPLGNLDSMNAKNVLEILKKLNEEDGKTIIMVTHESWSLQDVRTVYHMKDGVITSIEKRVAQQVGITTPKSSEEEQQEFIKKQLAKEAKKAESLHMISRILSSFFMRGHTFEETDRFETILLDRFTKKLDSMQYIALLCAPFNKKGAGLWKKKAERVSLYVEDLLEKQKSLDQVIDNLNKNPVMPITEEIKHLRNIMAEEYIGTISTYRNEILDELIGDRIRGNISAEHFLQLLHTPVKEAGAGIPVHTAQKMAERLEIIVGGAEIFDPIV